MFHAESAEKTKLDRIYRIDRIFQISLPLYGGEHLLGFREQELAPFYPALQDVSDFKGPDI